MPYNFLIIISLVIVTVFIIETDNSDRPSITTSDNTGFVKYDRKLYKHWIDIDGDCQNTRHEVLIAESVIPVVLDERGCKVISGKWEDPFTGNTYTDPRELDVDHMVPLKEAHVSGGYDWSPARRERYANDMSNPDALIAVSRSANRQKGAKDVAEWLPPNEDFRCEYVRRWVDIKEAWGLVMDVVEAEAVKTIMNKC